MEQRISFGVLACLLGVSALGSAQQPAAPPSAAPPVPPSIKDLYDKWERRIAMRDGVELHTAIYIPKDTSEAHPILLTRTPYSCSPYGADKFRETLGPSPFFVERRYIVAYQDVRGCFMSDGTFDHMRPHVDHKDPSRSPPEIDESTDAFDTIDWLVKNLPGHNGNVGLWGISYPGFYSSAGMIDAHPALKAVSPQAPIADWFFDDFHHHGAFFLPHFFNFMWGFGKPRQGLTTEVRRGGEHGTPDGYRFFLDLGALSNVDPKWYHGEVPYWPLFAQHPNYDGFWQARNLLPHLRHVAPAVMTVGGWFDAEDLYGALQTYRAIERLNPGVFSVLVMGPWSHGGWSRTDGDRLGNVHFGGKQSLFYREQIEFRFFEHYLRGQALPDLPEASLFETGANQWRSFAQWPPAEVAPHSFFPRSEGHLALDQPPAAESPDAFISDPRHPVPFTEAINVGMTKPYMTDDQRFATRRPDVLVYQSDPMSDDVTFAGPLIANLWVSTSQRDADWIVKLVDVFPDDFKYPPEIEAEMKQDAAKRDSSDSPPRPMSGYQMMVRSEVIRGRFRESYAQPKPFAPDEPTLVRVTLQDVLHTFQKNHRIMIQVQSTWFPLVDRNPQKWVDNIYTASDADFAPATHQLFHDATHATRIDANFLPRAPEPAAAGSKQ